MRALVIGFGSIGQRHARILDELGLKVAVLTRSTETGALPHMTSLESALEGWRPGYVVVANSTIDHYDTLRELERLEYRGLLLVEKPLFADIAPLPPKLPPFCVGYNLRCHPAVRAIHQRLDPSQPMTATLNVGQYLPSWRPGADYSQSYSARRALGGGVLRDLSHELDLATMLFGTWHSVCGDVGRFSTLDIDVEDTCAMLIRTVNNSLLSLNMDYLDRYGRREITIQTPTETVRADLVKGQLQVGDQCLDLRVDRDYTYTEMHKQMLQGEIGMLCSERDALDVVKLIAAVERSSVERRWIDNE